MKRFTLITFPAAFFLRAVLAVLFSLLSACAMSPATHIYTLHGFTSDHTHSEQQLASQQSVSQQSVSQQSVSQQSVSQQSVSQQSANAQYTIASQHTYGVGPVFLPEALNQPGIVIHEQGQKVDLALYNIWAGNLKDAITRVLASNLSDLTGVDAIWPFPWDNRSRPSRQIRVVIEHLSGELAGPVYLRAKWSVTAENGEKILFQKRSMASAPVSQAGYPGYVSAINQLINGLSVEMAEELPRLSSDPSL